MLKKHLKRLGLAGIIALILSGAMISPNFFMEKPQEERVEAFAPAIGVAPLLAGGVGSLALGPVAIGLGIAVAAVVVGVGVGKGVQGYRAHANEINAAVVDAWNNASGEAKKMWVSSAQDFIKRAKAGEKVVDSAGNYVMNVPKSLTHYLTDHLAAPANAEKTLNLPKGGDSTALSTLLTSKKFDLAQLPTKKTSGFCYISSTDYAIDLSDIPYYIMAYDRELIYANKWLYEDYMWVSWNDSMLNKRPPELVISDRYGEKARAVGYLPKTLVHELNTANISTHIKKWLRIAMANPSDIRWKVVPKDLSGDKVEKFTAAHEKNYGYALDNARKLLDGGTIAVPSPLCKIPRAFATGADNKLAHDIVWNGSLSNGQGQPIGGWVDGNVKIPESNLGTLGLDDINNPGAGTATGTLNPGLTWTIPDVSDWADNPGLVDTGIKTGAIDKPIDLVNEGLGTNVVDDAKPIDDAVALNPPTTLPKTPPGVVTPPATEDGIHWPKLTKLGEKFTHIFPFCIPFDIGDYVAGSIDSLERKEFKKYTVPIYQNYKFTLSIPHEFYEIAGIIKTILLVLYDVGLMYAVHKWFSALK